VMSMRYVVDVGVWWMVRREIVPVRESSLPSRSRVLNILSVANTAPLVAATQHLLWFDIKNIQRHDDSRLGHEYEAENSSSFVHFQQKGGVAFIAVKCRSLAYVRF